MRKRESDSEDFIRPQRQWADVVVSFYPPKDHSEESNGNLNVRLVLRPTIPHPDLVRLFEAKPEKAAVNLELDRDMGKPVDVLEIHGNATKEQVIDMEKVLCSEVPYLSNFCEIDSEIRIGKVIGTTGETIQSYPLALTQLLVTYHMLKASYSYQVK
jgi:phosphoribulokinase